MRYAKSVLALCLLSTPRVYSQNYHTGNVYFSSLIVSKCDKGNKDDNSIK